jgi:hypothetical protein
MMPAMEAQALDVCIQTVGTLGGFLNPGGKTEGAAVVARIRLLLICTRLFVRHCSVASTNHCSNAVVQKVRDTAF